MTIKVFVHPNSKKPRIEKDLFGGLNVYVSSPPLEGRANESVVSALADYFKVKKYHVSLIGGVKSKIKIFKIEQ